MLRDNSVEFIFHILGGYEYRKTFLNWSAVFILLLLAAVMVIITLRLSYAFQIFSFDSNANMPTVAPKSIVLSSDLRKPARFNYVVFHNEAAGGSAVWMLRLCGLPGDTVEIRNGELLVNNLPADSMLQLSHSYLIKISDTAGLHIDRSSAVAADSDAVMVTYSDSLARRLPVFHRYTLPDETIDSYMQKRYSEPWNTDHFGPIAVPPGHYFLLGDNRGNSMDSRYIGFVPIRDFRGTVLNY